MAVAAMIRPGGTLSAAIAFLFETAFAAEAAG